MIKFHNRKGGFTLIELMIVVAIIGILAAIAIPNFLRFQLKAKSSEGKTNIAAIRTAEEGYQAEFGSYIATAALFPPLAPTGVKQAWTQAQLAASNFDQIGWSPEGNVYFQYAVTIGTTAAPGFIVGAQANIDDSAITQKWGYVKQPTATATGAAALFTDCTNAGTYGGTDGAGAAITVTNTVGPCDDTSGQSEF